jgi:hypothetical protein
MEKTFGGQIFMWLFENATKGSRISESILNDCYTGIDRPDIHSINLLRDPCGQSPPTEGVHPESAQG